jgi:hypothetical protein
MVDATPAIESSSKQKHLAVVQTKRCVPNESGQVTFMSMVS